MIKTRNEIENKFKWDLGSLYDNDNVWESDYKQVNVQFSTIENFKGQILESKEQLLGVLEAISIADLTISRLSTYAKMKQDEDTNNDFYQELNSRAEALIGKYREATSFFVPELIQGDTDLIQTYLKDESLKMYNQHIDNILRSKPHTLSIESETILAQANEVLSTSSNAFGMLNSADLKFPKMINDKGEEVELTHGSFIPMLMSEDRTVRKEAFKKYYSVYNDHKNVFASLLSSEVKKNIFNAKSRHHQSARSAALFENNVPETVYDNLIKAVHTNLDAMHEYIALRKEMLGLEVLRPYDLYVPLVKEMSMNFDFEAGTQHMLNSLEVLGDEYVGIVKNSITDGWIDVYETRGKRSGAYSWGTYDSKPYILLNYHDKLNDVFTLTHEMGHSLHSYYSRQSQPSIYGNYSIFVAEVASTTNEALLNKYLLNNVTDKQEKIYLLNNYLENFRGTVFRQTMFAEFEKIIHQKVELGEALTATKLNEIYRTLNVKYYGEALTIDDELDLEWARIPHFYYNFYVFQYATGFSAAETLADMITEDPINAVKRYKEFLSAGCSDYPIEVLKKAGVDMTTAEPVEKALLVFRKLVEEMKTLIKES